MKFLTPFLLVLLAAGTAAQAADRRIVFIAGRPNHPPLEHEHRADCLLLQKCLAGIPGVRTDVYSNGWPTVLQDGRPVDNDPALDGADAIVMICDGGPGHPVLAGDRLQVLGRLMKKGVGFGLIHWALEPTNERGEKEFLEWIGGAFELNWTVNPTWTADFPTLPNHPVTRGVKPFSTHDEWSFNFRFRDDLRGVTPILTAVAPPSTMARKDGPRTGNPAARAAVARGEPQTLMWVADRDDGGRGFGFSGGHYHLGWKNDDERKLVLNAILWIAKVEVPPGGVESRVTDQDLGENLDPKPPARSHSAAAASGPPL